MNGLKKIMSAAIAAAALLAGTTFTVSADYDPYDVNRDGKVSPADLVQLNKYLCGAYSVTNYNRFDVNKSLTVDAADAECLKLRIFEKDYSSGYFSKNTGATVASPTVSGFTPSNSSSSSDGRTYRRCSYNSNGVPTAMSDYTLTQNSMTLPEANLNPIADPRAVIGDDERETFDGPESSGIVYLENIGTGFIVGDHQIATAAHCVYNGVNWYSMRIKTCDSNGCITNNALHPVEAHIPKSFVPSVGGMYDYALITVSEDLSKYVNFSLGTPYNVSASDYSNIPIYVTGYPGEKRPESGTRLFSAEGRVTNNPSAGYNDIVCYDVDMTSGQSGAPVYTITKIGSEYVYTAIAINCGGFEVYNSNGGSMITNYHLQFYLNNPNASYKAS